MPVSAGPGSAHASHRRPPARAGLQADAKFKPRRGSEEAAQGIAGGAPPRSTMGGSAAPCASAPRPTRARGCRGLIPGPRDSEGAGAPDDHAFPLRGPRGRGRSRSALATR